ncbi:MAG: NYN domain-containing protein [Candidatus Pacebacteria bacterium]|nr:NYN domain-containing protein [Candidatus Paceibacterota bacterium]
MMVTKDLQKIKHRINEGDKKRKYLEIRKCNFDVEISVDAIKMLKYYDTFCIFSSDADFTYLNKFLKSKKKKVIIVKGGHITRDLRNTADLIINAQDIKEKITRIKTKT